MTPARIINILQEFLFVITHKIIEDGYEFYNGDQLIAVGIYSSIGFEVAENDNGVSVHPNGVVALSYLRHKYTPEFYDKPVKFDFSKPAVIPGKRLDIFKSHPALHGVHPLANERS